MDLAIEFISRLPYWILGASMIFATRKSEYRDLIKIKKETVFKWAKFLLFLAFWRVLVAKIFPSFFGVEPATAISQVNWQLIPGVFWEDACFSMPLVILNEMMEGKWFGKIIYPIILLITMVSFGLGHAYQGPSAIIFAGLYILFATKFGKEYGFGTLMINHILYDLTTILAVKYLM